MPIKFSSDKPIFLQVADIIKSDIISGKLQANDKIPSVRELALFYSINPNTVQKALQVLEDDLRHYGYAFIVLGVNVSAVFGTDVACLYTYDRGIVALDATD